MINTRLTKRFPAGTPANRAERMYVQGKRDKENIKVCHVAAGTVRDGI